MTAAESAESSDRFGWLADWFGAVSRWTIDDIIMIAITFALLYYLYTMVGYFWITRRQPVRQDSPVTEAWKMPASKWDSE